MNLLRISLCFLLAVTGIAAAQKTLTAEGVLQLVAEAMEKADEIRYRAQEATTVAREWQSEASQVSRALAKPYDPERVKKLADSLGRHQEDLARREAMRDAAKVETPEERAARKAEVARQHEEIKTRAQGVTVEERRQQETLRRVGKELATPYSARRVADLTEWAKGERWQVSRLRDQLAAASVKLPNERAARKAEADAQVKEAQRAYQAVQEPFDKDLEDLREDYREVSDALAALLHRVPFTPKELGIASTKVFADATGGSVRISWYDAQGTRLTWAWLSFQRRPAPAKRKNQLMLAKKYPAGSLNERRIAFRTGGVSTAFYVDKAEWKGSDKVIELVPKLIDLDALAAFPMLPPPE